MLSPKAIEPLERKITVWSAAEFGDMEGLRSFEKFTSFASPKVANQPQSQPHMTFDDQDDRGFTPLAWSCRNGHHQAATFLIEEKQVDLEKASFGGLRPLHHACNKMHEKVVKVLVRAGADVNAADENGDTPLHYAAARGVLNVVLLLLESNADPTRGNNQGVTPVHKAAIFGQTSIIKKFTESGYNLSILSVGDSQGDTALHYAARGGYVNMVKLLIELGADSTKRNNAGDTPKTVASNSNIIAVLP